MTAAASPPRVPLVVHVGMAGPRFLFPHLASPGIEADAAATAEVARLEAQLVDLVAERLRELPAALGLEPHHFLCVVSQVAIGADTVLTRACQRRGIAQRFFLPQHRQGYLAAVSPEGVPDFAPHQRQAALDLLRSPHVIEEREASKSQDREAQFEETNLEILQASDVLVCLSHGRGGSGKPAGTQHLVGRARAQGKPVLELQVRVDEDGAVSLSPMQPVRSWCEAGATFAAPCAPTELAGLHMPVAAEPAQRLCAADYAQRILAHADARSGVRSRRFKRAAAMIIAFHVAATVAAILAGKPLLAWIVVLLLLAELGLLGAGLWLHRALHHGQEARVWAVCRLVAEVMRSLHAVSRIQVPLEYPLAIPLSPSLQALVRTAAVLQLHVLRARTGVQADAWKACRAAYIDHRLTSPDSGQMPYYDRQAALARKHLRRVNHLFLVCSVGAIVAASAKVLLVLGGLPAPMEPVVQGWGGLLAIALPVAAVGFASWAAADDLEARQATFSEMHAFLHRQETRLKLAHSEREFIHLVHETETRMLSENVNWFARRSFTGVA